MVEILLVNPKEEGGFFEKMPPLGIAYVAASLEKHGHAKRIADLEVEDEPLKHWLDLYQPRYLGISGASHTRFESFRLAREAKDYIPDITIFYGGVHASCTGVNILRDVSEIDYVVCGEGENTAVALLDTLACGAGVRIYPGTFLEEYAREKRLLPDGFEWSLPYDEPRLERIFQTRSIPVLIQPQLAYDELEQVALKIYSRRFKGWHGCKYSIKKITDWQKLKKLSHIARIKMKNIMKRHN